jgi:hypothetical protein
MWINYLRALKSGQYEVVPPFDLTYDDGADRSYPTGYDAISVIPDEGNMGFLITEGRFKEGVSITPFPRECWMEPSFTLPEKVEPKKKGKKK